MQGEESRRQLYQMMAAQLQHDGFHDAARIVARSTMCTSLPLNGDPSRLLGLATLGMHAEAVGMSGGYLNRNDWRVLPCVEGHVGSGDSAVAPTDERWSRFSEKYAASAKQAVRATCFSQDGMYAAAGSSDGTVRIHDVPAMHSRYLRHDDGTICRTYHDHTQAVHNVCFHPTDAMLITGGRDGKIHMHGYTNPANKTAVRTIDDTYPIRGLVCHPGGKHLLYSTDHPSLRFYDIERGQILTNALADQHKNAVWDVAYSGDGRRFASASADGVLKVWNGVAGHVSVVKNASADPDEHSISGHNASADADSTSDDVRSRLPPCFGPRHYSNRRPNNSRHGNHGYAPTSW